MTVHSPQPPTRRTPQAPALVALLCALAGVLALALPAAARAGTVRSTKLVRYDGWSARVPRSWPVFRLGRDSHVCVRFNRHAVYLGRPGDAQDCPAHAAGRTEAILVSPAPLASGADAVSEASSSVAPSGGAVAQVRLPATHVVVTATWARHPSAVRDALRVRLVAATGRAYTEAEARSIHRLARLHAALARPDVATTPATPTTSTTPATPIAPATAGEVYTGLGFDACSAPSATAMTHWLSSPFRAIGVYIGGPEMACTQSNLSATWTSAEAAAGWHLIPIYVGLQSPTNGCGCTAISAVDAAAQGTAAAESAVQEAQALGLGAGNPIYDDMENYTRTTVARQTVLTYLQAWTQELHALGYLSGVYSSELSGVEDLVAEQGTGYIEPDELWIANWNNQETTTDAQVPATEWADNQRLHQYLGGHTDDYGGSSIDVDSDDLDAATAAPGAGALTSTIAAAPSVGVTPQGDGTVVLAPGWTGESGVARWEILAGSSPTALTAQLSVPVSHKSVLTRDGDPYFQVQALSSTGQVIGSSGVTPAPAHVAMFGHSAFVPRTGPGGLPVECFEITGCRISTTIKLGKKLLVHTGGARVAAGGGIDHFPVSASVHRLVTKAGNKGLSTTITVRTSTGRSATEVIRLVPFTVAGAGPRRRSLSSSAGAVRILGGTEFVSHGWTGGVLVACPRSTPCTATPTLRVHGRTVAVSHSQTIGAEEIGYLSFQMTGAGHRLLMRATGNQLGATIAVSTSTDGLVTGGTASAAVALDAF